MKQLYIFSFALLLALPSFGQFKSLKGDGQIFWQEDFNWANPADPRGWTLPEGWIIEDNSYDDTGFVWGWTKDSLQGPFSKRDGGYILNSTTGANGFLAIDMDKLNAYVSYPDMLYVNSSIILPVLDCSAHPSVILSLEQLFKYLNSPRMVIEVSNDAGAHWAEFDLKMGTGSGVNTQNLKNNQVARYTANLSEVAGGQSAVTIKITWEGSILYFWMLDDITIGEGWDYDLKMNHWDVELVDNSLQDAAGFYYMMPKTQILPLGGFEGSVTNNGDQDLSDVYFNVTIQKNGQEQFNQNSGTIRYLFFGDPADTLSLTENYTPTAFGHYKLTFSMNSNEEEQTPENNVKSYFFHVTDSVFARTPDTSEADESPWRNFYQYTHEGDYMGVEFDPVADCEASSISVFVSRANIGADFRVALLEIQDEGSDEPVVELIGSEVVPVDSALLQQGWITLPLEKDGVGEWMKAGKRYIAAVQFWTYIEEDNLINRANAFYIGSSLNYPDSYDKQWLFEAYDGTWTQGSRYNKMIRLNINNHDNLVDGVGSLPLIQTLEQNYPNPFKGSTSIHYELAEACEVELEVSDLTGRIVLSLHQGHQTAGSHDLELRTGSLQAGIYSYTLKAGSSSQTRKMILTN